MLEEIGRESEEQLHSYGNFFAFIGETASTTLASLLDVRKLRWKQIATELQLAGVNALPIVGLLAFLLGVVIAYQGGTVLRDYGADVFIVDIVALSMVRELAPLITAIIVAGRTGSAYTAQIGTMMVTRGDRRIAQHRYRAAGVAGVAEDDRAGHRAAVAHRVRGLHGTRWRHRDVALAARSQRPQLRQSVGGSGFGDVVPEPASAKRRYSRCLIALVGCFQGFQVSGSAEGVWTQTTISVVQSIFLVIVIDAAFSIAFNHLGIGDDRSHRHRIAGRGPRRRDAIWRKARARRCEPRRDAR